MKGILFFIIVTMLLGSCVHQRQRSNIAGRTDEVYFTPSDTRIKGYLIRESTESTEPLITSRSYTGSYADRLCNFGSGNCFLYKHNNPLRTPSLSDNDYDPWAFGYNRTPYFTSPNYPYCGCCSFAYNNNFGNYASFYGYSTYPFGYGYYGPYYNSYYNPYRNYSFQRYNYGRRIGSTLDPNRQGSSTKTNTSDTKTGNKNWWDNSSGPSSSGSRNTPGNTNSSTRRR